MYSSVSSNEPWSKLGAGLFAIFQTMVNLHDGVRISDTMGARVHG